MKKLALVSVSLLLITTGIASAGYSTTGSSGEVSTLEIFQNLYGAGMGGDNWCGSAYTDGTITATRVEDYSDPYSQPGTPGDNLYLLSTSLLSTATDQLWIDGVATVTARARYAGYQQQLGYDDGSGYVEILDVGDNTGFINISAGPIFFPPGTTWQWVRKGEGLTWFSKEDDNSDDLDHLITYYVTGLNDGKITWVVFWDDQTSGSDRDFNDFVLVITAQTIVPNIIGQEPPDANSVIIEASLVVGTKTEECNDTMPTGLVLSQDPEAGTVMPVGSAVNYIVSSGPCTRTLTTSSSDGGSVTTPGEGDFDYGHGEDANIVATPDMGYHFVNWTGTGVDAGKVANANAASTTITMDDDYAVTANYAVNTYSLTVNNGTGSGTYDHNETVPIGADAPPAGSHFTGWTGDTENVEDVNSESTNIVMLSGAEVTANYAVNTYSLTVNNGTGSGTYDHNETVPIGADAPPAGSHFTGWTGDTENVEDVNSESTNIVMLSGAEVTANYAVNTYSLTVNNGTGSGTYDHNETVPIGADAPPAGSHFTGWTGDTENVEDVNSESTNIVMLSGAEVTANYAVNTYSLTVNNGTGSGTYDHNETVPIGADAPPAGSHFTGWTGDTENVEDVNSESTNIVMLSGAEVTANYAVNTYSLTVNNGTGSGTYDHNETVPIGADAPPAGSHFTGWTGDTENVEDVNSESTNIVMLGGAEVTANYAVNTYSLTVNNGTGSGTYDHNETVPIGADAPPAGSHFTGWTGDTENVEDVNSESTNIVMLSGAEVTANYAVNTYSLTVNNGTGSGTYDHNETVPIGADAPPAGSHFTGWTGDTENVEDVNSESTNIVMLSGAEVTANYAVNTYSLTVNNGTGSGTYDHNETVPIGADAPPAGSHFTGWTGDTENVEDVNSESTNIVMLSGAEVTANYAVNTYSLTVNNGTGSGTYDHNETVPIGADAPPAGSHFTGWTGDTENVEDANSESTNIVMLSGAEVTANYAVNTYSLTVNNGTGSGTYDHNETVPIGADAPPAGSHFTNWTGDTENVEDVNNSSTTIIMLSDANVTANYAINQYTLTTSSTQGGSVTIPGEPGPYDYNDGQVVPIVATADTGSHFVNWTGDVANVNDIYDPCTTITMYGNYIVKANFALNKHTLDVNSTSGGSVMVPGEGQFSYGYGMGMNLEAEAETGYHFVEWTGDINTVAEPCSASTAIIIYGDYSITANFAINTYTLTVNNGSGSGTYDYNEPAAIQADPDPAGSHFTGWTGDTENVADVNSASTNIVMLSDAEVTANYAINQYTVTALAGDNGSISPAGDTNVNHGDDLMLEATPDSCYEVDTWYLDGNDLEINDVSYTLTNITANHTVEATFKLLQVIVPDVLGITEAQAEAALNAVGLEKGGVTYVYSATPEGLVIDQEPDGGTSVACGSSVNLVVSMIDVYVWTNESPYSVLWIDPLNWDPNGVPGEGDTAIVNPPPEQGPVVEHDMSVGYIDGSRWTDGDSRWDIENPRFEKYGWDFDSNQIIQIVSGYISIGKWQTSNAGTGTSTINIGLGIGWGDPCVHINDGFRAFTDDDADGEAYLNIGGNSYVYVNEDFEIFTDEDAEGYFEINIGDTATVEVKAMRLDNDTEDAECQLTVSGSATLNVFDGQLRHSDKGTQRILITDDAYVYIDDTFRGADGDDGSDETHITGNAHLVANKGWESQDGTTLWTVDGNALVEVFDSDMYYRNGVLNVGGTATLLVEKDLQLDQKTMVFNMYDCGPHVVCEGLGLPSNDDSDFATFNLHGGLIEIGENGLYHDNDDWLLDICECGVMVIDGDVVDEIWEGVDDGKITVCGYYQGCGSQGDLMVEYDPNEDKTTVSVEYDTGRAYNPDPICCTDPEAEPVPQELCLTWDAGEGAEEHYVFLSTNYTHVSTGDLCCLVAITEEAEYCTEPLILGATYYWRVDEVCDSGDCETTEGQIWCFVVTSCVSFDDMESYDNADPNNYIWATWIDGAGDVHGQGGNGTGSAAFTATDPVNSGDKSMEYFYNSTGWEREYAYSEVQRPLDPAENFADNGEKVLRLWFYGNPDNITESMWVALTDGSANTALSTYGILVDSPDDIKNAEWKDWVIDLQDFADGGVNLEDIVEISIGFGERGRDGEHPGDPMGVVHFDDISLCSTLCVPRYAPDGDVNDDCVVDWGDVEELVEDWLEDLR